MQKLEKILEEIEMKKKKCLDIDVCGPPLSWNDEWTDDDSREFFI